MASESDLIPGLDSVRNIPGVGSVGQNLAFDERLDATFFQEWHLFGVAQLAVWFVFKNEASASRGRSVGPTDWIDFNLAGLVDLLHFRFRVLVRLALESHALIRILASKSPITSLADAHARQLSIPSPPSEGDFRHSQIRGSLVERREPIVNHARSVSHLIIDAKNNDQQWGANLLLSTRTGVWHVPSYPAGRVDSSE